MDELTQIPSRLGQISTGIAVFDFVGMIVLAIIGALALSLLSGELKYSIGGIAFMAFFIFPLISILGLILGAVGIFQPNYAKFYSILGVVLNVVNLILWVGFIFFQITFNAGRFRM